MYSAEVEPGTQHSTLTQADPWEDAQEARDSSYATRCAVACSSEPPSADGAGALGLGHLAHPSYREC